MALTTRTLGTNATNSMLAFIVGLDEFDGTTLNPVSSGAGLGEQYVAQLNNAIRLDPVSKGLFGISKTTPYNTNVGTFRQRLNQAYSRQGYLIIPGRGKLVLKAGDIIAVDATTGWPFVISGDCAANGAITYTAT